MTDLLPVTNAVKINQPFHAFGFEVSVTDDGRRIWTRQFKKFVIAKLINRELTAKQIKDECRIATSQVYQWKMHLEGKDTSSREYGRRKQKLFTEVTLQECESSTEVPVHVLPRIEITIMKLGCPYRTIIRCHR